MGKIKLIGNVWPQMLQPGQRGSDKEGEEGLAMDTGSFFFAGSSPPCFCKWQPISF